MTVQIRRTRWGWTATHPNGVDVAHSRSRSLLLAYLTTAGLTWRDAP